MQARLDFTPAACWTERSDWLRTGVQGLGPTQGHFGAAPPLVSFFRQHAQPQDVFSTVLRLAGGPISLGGANAQGGSLYIGGIDPAITALNQDLTWCAAALADANTPRVLCL